MIDRGLTQARTTALRAYNKPVGAEQVEVLRQAYLERLNHDTGELDATECGKDHLCPVLDAAEDRMLEVFLAVMYEHLQLEALLIDRIQSLTGETPRQIVDRTVA